MAGARLRVAALGRAEGLQAFVASRDIALDVRRDVVLRARAAMVAEALDRTPACAVLQADGIPVGAAAFIFVERGAARHHQKKRKARSGTQAPRSGSSWSFLR